MEAVWPVNKTIEVKYLGAIVAVLLAVIGTAAGIIYSNMSNRVAMLEMDDKQNNAIIARLAVLETEHVDDKAEMQGIRDDIKDENTKLWGELADIRKHMVVKKEPWSAKHPTAVIAERPERAETAIDP